MTPQAIMPRGFRGTTARLGLKENGDDFAIVVSEVPARSAAVFTRSRFAGPSVALSRAAAGHRNARGFVAISKNANVATGQSGFDDAAEVRDRAAKACGVAPEELLIASTGVIGIRYPMELIRAGLSVLPQPLPEPDLAALARAIMTTDTRPKFFHSRCGDAVIAGIAKGVGMMEPDMATLLTFFCTDADIPATDLDAIFRRVVDRTYNALSIDTDTSTSDSAAIFANGLAGPVDLGEFERCLYAGALGLVRDIASDGEGATKLIEVQVTGARDAAQAKRAAKAIVNSPLVKTAVHGCDPNWGRIVMALGKLHTDTDIEPERVQIRLGDIALYPQPQTPELSDRARAYLGGDQVVIGVDLGIASGRFTAYGCDLTEGYVRINADYTT